MHYRTYSILDNSPDSQDQGNQPYYGENARRKKWSQFEPVMAEASIVRDSE